MLYSPRGDFKSIVKRMEVKLRYSSVDRESKFCVFRYSAYFLTLSLSGCFLQRYFPDLYIEPESALYIKQNSHKLRQFCILIPMTVNFFPYYFRFFFLLFSILKMFTLKPHGGALLWGECVYGKLAPQACGVHSVLVKGSPQAVNVRPDGKSLRFEVTPESYSPVGPCCPTAFLPLP